MRLLHDPTSQGSGTTPWWRAPGVRAVLVAVLDDEPSESAVAAAAELGLLRGDEQRVLA